MSRPPSVSFALDGIPKTLFIPLFYRSQETNGDEPLLRDADAARIVAESGIDFSPLVSGFGNRMSRAGTVNRTLLIDDSVRRFLEAHRGGTVVNVGCGLDARFWRLDDGRVRWIDLDVPQVVALRERVLPGNDGRHSVLAGSLLEPDWMEEIPRDEPAMLLCEGTLMYFTEGEVRTFLCAAIDRLPHDWMCLEVAGPWMANRVHPSVRAIGLDALPLRWGSRDFEAIAGWHPRARIDRHRTVFDIHLQRFGLGAWLARLVPGFKTGMGSSIVDVSIEPA